MATGPSRVLRSLAPNLPAAAKEACAALESTESQLGSAQVSGTFPTTNLSSGILARSHLGVNLHTRPYTCSKVRGPGALGRLHRAKCPTQSSPGGLEHTTAVCRGRNTMAFSLFLLKNKTKQPSSDHKFSFKTQRQLPRHTVTLQESLKAFLLLFVQAASRIKALQTFPKLLGAAASGDHASRSAGTALHKEVTELRYWRPQFLRGGDVGGKMPFSPSVPSLCSSAPGRPARGAPKSDSSPATGGRPQQPVPVN